MRSGRCKKRSSGIFNRRVLRLNASGKSSSRRLDIERRADDFSQASLKAVQETVERLSEFREMLRGFGHSEKVIASHLFLVPKAEPAQSVPGRGRGLAISH